MIVQVEIGDWVEVGMQKNVDNGCADGWVVTVGDGRFNDNGEDEEENQQTGGQLRFTFYDAAHFKEFVAKLQALAAELP